MTQRISEIADRLAAVTGKRLVSARHEELTDQERFGDREALTLEFEDGSRLVVRSAEPYEHQSWLEIGE